MASAGAAASGLLAWPDAAFQVPTLALFQPDLAGAFDLRYLDETLVLLYVVVVDVVATLETIATCSPAMRNDDGRPRRFDRALFTSALVFLASPFLGTAPMLVLFESLGGVMSGARTAIAALVCAAGFVALLFVAPLAQAIPAFACAVALGFIGLEITRHALAAPADGCGTADGLATRTAAGRHGGHRDRGDQQRGPHPVRTVRALPGGVDEGRAPLAAQ